MNKKPRNTTGKGYYKVKGTEPLAKRPIALRLPESVDKELREIVGDNLTEWLRQAIAYQVEGEKVEREQQMSA